MVPKNPSPALHASPSSLDSSVIYNDPTLLKSPSPSLPMKFPHIVLPNVDSLSPSFADGYVGFDFEENNQASSQ